ncbi:MAG: isoleucine--tRNA ligase [Ruminococcaceae bacterium]|nr:isoleucine--tRNA ligase [Oscillospiraceae bacterium]
MAQDYGKTLNLPKTDFPMRANLPQNEPKTLDKWETEGLYKKLMQHNAGKPSYILHDGPPFSNGNIHMGTAMNKILKDFIIKSKAMTGYNTPYVPGWDNHGMPIESAIIKKNKLDRKKMSVSDFRKECQKFAENFVDIQRTSFKRLGVVGDWENPYLTMAPEFEEREVLVFGEMYKKGYIYKGLKPVYWCPTDETALAESEIEYTEDACKSVYVKFAVDNDNGKLDGIDLANTYFIIWTTTVWTLPGNMAIALNPKETYVVAKADGKNYIVAKALLEKTMSMGGIENYEIIAEYPGNYFEYMTAKHPFIDRTSLIVNADYVTMESGTGCVHTAPGYGMDDYFTGMKYKMNIIVPVDDRGYQGEEAGKFAGLFYEESNKAIYDDMVETGALFASEDIVHQYPHCWRCKKPIIFRATPQWFCSVEAFKDAAVAACDSVEWLPKWGGDRIVSMIRERADWCISRQRNWGLPIPVFYCEDCGEIICDEATIASISKKFGQLGSNAWFDLEATDLLPENYVCPKCGKAHFRKETDTLDCWFDSGSTHFSVLDREGLSWPADMYLEGADQYRGWFQSSLLTAVGAKNQGAPYKTVLTHGWVVDGEGKAMHKSLGNSVAPEEIIKDYGADMLRLWVASSDYRVDVRASDAIFKQLSEAYRKIRNTIRILLANLGTPEEDFDPNKDMVPFDKMYDIDKWIVSELNNLCEKVRKAYESFEYHIIYHEVHDFCTNELSKIYVDITKDRVYVEEKDSFGRRSAQTAMYICVNYITRLLAPILSYTAEETWSYMAHLDGENAESVFLNDLPAYDKKYENTELSAKWNALLAVRDDVMKALEVARAEKLVGKSLDASIVIYGDKDNEAIKLFEEFADELKTVFIVSKASVCEGVAPEGAFTDTASGIAVSVSASTGTKCDRCWYYSDDIKTDSEGQHLCPRCSAIIKKITFGAK